MKKSNRYAPRSLNTRSNKLAYQVLEPRQVLTSLYYPGFSLDHHVPQDSVTTIATDLTVEPNITTQPEFGALEFDSTTGSLTYRPNAGFTGSDTFELVSQHNDQHTNEHSVRVWESAYAVQDWTLVQPGKASTIDVLANDYSFQKHKQPNSDGDATFQVIGRGYSADFYWQQDASEFNIVDVSGDLAGNISISDDGRSLIYESASEFSGTEFVTYSIENSLGHVFQATVTIEVSNESLDEYSYFNEAHFEQVQIEDWLDQRAQSLTSSWHRYYDLQFTSRVGTTFFSAVADATTTRATYDGSTTPQEGDIVKSHGDLIYYVTHNSEEITSEDQFSSYLSIVDVSNPNSPTLVSTTGFNNRINDIFLGEGRAAVILNKIRISSSDSGYRASSERKFDLVVLDLSDSESPSQIYQATIDGNYREARLVGDELYVISGTPSNNYSLSPSQLDVGDSPTSVGQYIDAVLNTDNAFKLPMIEVEVGGVSTTQVVDHSHIVRRDSTYTSTLVTTFDIGSNSGQPLDIDVIESNHINTIYVSQESVFLFDGASAIKLAFNADSPGVEFTADGELRGHLLGQFAADEFGGYLRVAMTDNTDGSSDVRVFEQIDNTLVLVSTLEDIAPGERIYSTHFAEDQLFVVTFRQIDPLFVIDLTDPTSPAIAGELKIPGVSNYLRLIGDDILLAVGRDANESTGRFGALQVSLFDVSDAGAPELLDRYTFEGGRRTETPLIESWWDSPNHHALTFDFTNNVLSLPVFSNGNWGSNGLPIFTESASAFSLFELDRENGIQPIGQVDFATKALRTVLVSDTMAYLSEDGLKTAARVTPTDVIATMELPTGTDFVSGDSPVNALRQYVFVQKRIEAPHLMKEVFDASKTQIERNFNVVLESLNFNDAIGPQLKRAVALRAVEVKPIEATILLSSIANEERDLTLDRFITDFNLEELIESATENGFDSGDSEVAERVFAFDSFFADLNKTKKLVNPFRAILNRL
ncbi:MAG: beta-propeller domain-containing protein [Mariniblastus sp.]